MPGSGTRQGTTRNDSPPARLLDLTRSLTRTGRQATGIDRVERAYLEHLLARAVPLFGLVRTGAGYVLLDEDGLRAARDRLVGAADWGAADLLSSLFRKRPQAVRQAESGLRKLALARCRPNGLAKMLARHVPAGSAYLNVGHTQLERAHLQQIKSALGGPVAVLIHDTIPLDYPEYSKPIAAKVFATRLQAARAEADMLICNSNYTASRLRTHLTQWGAIPPLQVAPLGVTIPQPDPHRVPAGLPVDKPYFIALGTLEPRKRQDFLLDVWEDLMSELPKDDVPGLFLCGARGWYDDGFYKRLDALGSDGPVHVLHDLPDSAVASLLQNAQALLFPSEAEGFGLPPLEAAALDTPVVVLDLPVYRETLGNKAVYLIETDCYLWRNLVSQLAEQPRRGREAEASERFAPPRWEDHFDVVCKVT